MARHTDVDPAAVDLTAPGVTHVDVRVAADDGNVEHLPLTVIANGDGPTLVLTAGVHGDEFEGPAVLGELARSLAASSIRGRLIIAPAVNPAALRNRSRASPADGLDLNRGFPGRARGGSITEAIAAFVNDRLVAAAGVVFDLHAGGSAEWIMPSVMIAPRQGNPSGFTASLAAMHAFAAPVALITEDDPGMLDAAVARAGKVFGCAELGSAGTLTPQSLTLARAGVRRLIGHLGMWRQDVAPEPPAVPPRLATALGPGAVIRAATAGFFVPVVAVGETVAPGDRIGRLVDFAGVAVTGGIEASTPGFVYSLAAGGPLRQGDMVATVATPVAVEGDYFEAWSSALASRWPTR